MKGTLIFSDRNHFLSQRELFPSLHIPRAVELRASGEHTNGFLGFGVALTGAACYELSLMPSEERRALLKHVYTKEGLGLSVGRISIGSCDYSPELYSYDDTENDVSLKHFSIERDEKYIIPMLKEILEINPDLYLFASPWSPPYWMKTGGSMCGGYMRNEFVPCYAAYIVKFIKAYAAHGIKISAITPQNEPETQQQYKNPSCAWHPETEAAFIKCLRQAFTENSLDIKIWMHDHCFEYTRRVLWSLSHYEGLKDAVDGIAFHYYGGAVEETAELRTAHPSLELHFTEGGPRLTDHYDTDCCKWGLMISRALRMGYRSFTGWNLLLDELGGPNIGKFIGICGGLVTRDSRTGELSYSGQYKVLSHISPYVTPTSDIYPISVPETFGQCISKYPDFTHPIEGLVIDNHDGKKIAVLINQNAAPVQSQIALNGRLWYVELEADSVSTVIIE